MLEENNVTDIVRVTTDSRDTEGTISLNEAAQESGFSRLTVYNRVQAAGLVEVARLLTGGRGRPTPLYERTAVSELLLVGEPRPRQGESAQAVVNEALSESSDSH